MAKITTPVTEPSQIQSILGYSGITDYGAIFKLPTINKYNINKPIRYPKLHQLTDSEKRGTIGDINNGIVYGLQVGVPGKLLGRIHEANWDYVGRPSGGIDNEPYRTWDFVGYNTEAQPSMWGEGIYETTEVIANSETPLSVFLWWNRTNNTDGIPLDTVLDISFSSLYLYIAIDNYITMLKNQDMNGYYPVYHNNTECKSFVCPALHSDLIVNTDTTRRVSVFLAPLDISMQGTWKVWGSDDICAYNVCTIPEMAGLNVMFKYKESTVEIVKNFTGVLDASGNSITYSFIEGADFNRYSGNMRINIVAYQVSSNVGGGEIAPGGSYSIPITTAISYTELIRVIMEPSGWVPMSGDVYNIYASAQYYDGSNWQTQVTILTQKEY